MPEIEDECVFDVTADKAILETKTNGDLFRIVNLDLTKEQAASLAWLVNHGEEVTLEVQIKVKD